MADYKITNVGLLGTEYNVVDRTGTLLKHVRVIQYQDILDATMGEYNEEFDEIDTYLKQSVSKLCGFDNIDPRKVWWFSTYKESIELQILLEDAYIRGYEIIILEQLVDMDYEDED